MWVKYQELDNKKKTRLLHYTTILLSTQYNCFSWGWWIQNMYILQSKTLNIFQPNVMLIQILIGPPLYGTIYRCVALSITWGAESVAQTN